jgi:hypothetical protein
MFGSRWLPLVLDKFAPILILDPILAWRADVHKAFVQLRGNPMGLM